MRRIALSGLILGLLARIAMAACDSTTPPTVTTRAGFFEPVINACGWGTTLNNNFTILDASMCVQGVANTFTSTNTFNQPIIIGNAQPLKFNDASTHFISLRSPSVVTTTNFLLPTADGLNGQFLGTNGAGQLAFASASAGLSTLGVNVNGVSVSSPTAQINFSTNFQGTLVGGTTANIDLANAITVSTANINTTLNFGDNINTLSTMGGKPFMIANPVVSGATYMGWAAGGGDPNAIASNSTAFGNLALDGGFAPNSCSAFGAQTESSMSTGFENSAFGAFAMAFATSAISNDAFGFRSLWHLTTGANDSCFGEACLQTVTTGGSNACLGYNCLGNMTGNANSAACLGTFCLSSSLVSGSSCLGAACLERATTATANTAVGGVAGQFITTGGSNSLFGDSVGQTITTGTFNTLVGANANVGNVNVNHAGCIGANCTVSASNVFQIGGSSTDAILVNMSTFTVSSGTVNGPLFDTGLQGISSTFGISAATFTATTDYEINGSQFLTDQSASAGQGTFVGITGRNTGSFASEPTCIGNGACAALTTGARVTAVGKNAGNKLTSGANLNDTCIGDKSCAAATTSNRNACVGTFSCLNLTDSTGGSNVAVGDTAMQSATTASNNVCIGQDCMDVLTTGSNDVAIGPTAAGDMKSGFGNTCVGANGFGLGQACSGIKGGSNNTMIGVGASAFNGSASGNSSSNTIVGAGAGLNSVNDIFDSICLGINCVLTTSNTAVIGHIGGAEAVQVNMSTFSVSSGSVSTALILPYLSNGQCVQAAADGKLVSSGGSCGGGGGGASTLQVTQGGVQITSPTASMNFQTNQFTLAAVGSTSTIALNASSVTLQAQNVIDLTSTLQSGATFYVSSGTVDSQLNVGNAGGSIINFSGTGFKAWKNTAGLNPLGILTLTQQSLGGSPVGFRFDDTLGNWVFGIDTVNNGAGTAKLRQNITISSPTTMTGELFVSSGIALSGSEGTNGQALTSGGPGTIPTWTTIAGGGASALAISSGAATNSVIITSPTSNVVFDSNTISGALQGTTTTFLSLRPSSVTLQGQNVINLTSSLQSGATFFVSSGTAQNFQASTITVNGTGNGNIQLTISGSTFTVTSSSFTSTATVGGPVVWLSTNAVVGNPVGITNSQALCLLAGALGHCTSAVGAGGACTCVSP